MKKIKLTEIELTKIIKKVVNEQSEECSGGSYFENMGYRLTSGGYYKKAITPAVTFYIKGTPTTASDRCNFELFWGDGMNPIDVGQPDWCYGIVEAYEEAFKMERAK